MGAEVAQHATSESAFSGHLDGHTRTSVTAKGSTLRMTWHREANKKQDI